MAEKRGMNERIQKLRELSVTTPVHIDLERAKIETDFYRENDGKYSIPVMRAMVLKEYFSKKTLYLGDGELIVGEKLEIDPQASPTGMLIPAVMFSGEEQMGVLMKEYAGYMAIALIGIAFLKIILTNLCIQFGLKGGHFFPVIFAGVCLGYGLAMLFFGQQGDSHVVFAAAIVTSTLLGGIMKKPLAVTMLLFLCFPVKTFIWIFIAAAVGSKCVKKMGKEV